MGIRIVIEIIDIIERWQNSRLVPFEEKKNIDDFDKDRGLFAVSKYEPPKPEPPKEIPTPPKQFSRDLYMKEKDGWNKGGSTEDTFAVNTEANTNPNNDFDDIEVPDYLKYYSTKQFPVKPVKNTRAAININSPSTIWIIVLVLIHILCLYRFTNDFIKQYTYDQTAANILRVETHLTESEEESPTKTITVTFSYTYNGQVYSGAYNADTEPQNRSISVFVNPDNPNDYWVIKSRPEVLIILFFDCVIALAIVLNKLNKKE